jgi:hypothetical protein
LGPTHHPTPPTPPHPTHPTDRAPTGHRALYDCWAIIGPKGPIGPPRADMYQTRPLGGHVSDMAPGGHVSDTASGRTCFRHGLRAGGELPLSPCLVKVPCMPPNDFLWDSSSIQCQSGSSLGGKSTAWNFQSICGTDLLVPLMLVKDGWLCVGEAQL